MKKLSQQVVHATVLVAILLLSIFVYFYAQSFISYDEDEQIDPLESIIMEQLHNAHGDAQGPEGILARLRRKESSVGFLPDENDRGDFSYQNIFAPLIQNPKYSSDELRGILKQLLQKLPTQTQLSVYSPNGGGHTLPLPLQVSARWFEDIFDLLREREEMTATVSDFFYECGAQKNLATSVRAACVGALLHLEITTEAELEGKYPQDILDRAASGVFWP